MNRIVQWIATVSYVGYSPIAPGTAGSFAAAMLYWSIPALTIPVHAAILVCLTGVGIWAASRAEDLYGHDASRIVIDEFAGYLLSVIFLPKTWLVIVLAFFIFRFFDIVKPFPVNRAEKLRGGLGIMADDLLAGLYTNLLLQILVRILM